MHDAQRGRVTAVIRKKQIEKYEGVVWNLIKQQHKM